MADLVEFAALHWHLFHYVLTKVNNLWNFSKIYNIMQNPDTGLYFAIHV